MAVDIEPPQQDAQVQMVAKRLLMGEQGGPPAAWLMRADLLRRTWAWKAAQRLLEGPRQPTPD